MSEERSVPEAEGTPPGHGAAPETGITEAGNGEDGNAETGHAENGGAETGNAEDGDAETGNAEVDDAETGNADVDDALARLPELDTLPTAEHVAVFEDVHARLQEKLSELDGS